MSLSIVRVHSKTKPLIYYFGRESVSRLKDYSVGVKIHDSIILEGLLDTSGSLISLRLYASIRSNTYFI